jgi:NAD(P)-dependent dehydrogenase (short-subunit alcohol dehydrogenase family)
MQNNTSSKATRTGKVWFVTGTSRGLGKSFVEQLLAAGFRVAATSRTLPEPGPTTANYLPLAMDVTNETSVNIAVKKTLETFGALDVVVNNAGYGQLGAVEELSSDEIRKDFEVNVFGVYNVLRAALPILREQKSGHIFNISSVGGYVGAFPGWSAYIGTKFALSGITEALHAEMAPHGVTTTLVYPGYFRTSFLKDGSLVLPRRQMPEYANARESEKMHLGTIDGNQTGDPAKAVAALIGIYERGEAPLHLFLGSDAVKFAQQKARDVMTEVEALRAISLSTDY